MAARTYRVTGMSCEHCGAAVASELSKVRGVSEVSVDLQSGRVSVCGEDYTDEQVRAAVAEAGYELADA